MIGVIANSSEYAVICEFFELFKTPWEFYRRGLQYDVLLCAGNGSFDDSGAKLVLVYAGESLVYDAKEKIQITSQKRDSSILNYKGTRLPIYGDSVTFRGKNTGLLGDEISQQPAITLNQTTDRVNVRVGYNLFDEVRTLLTKGQPTANANIPTLDLHITLLRDLIISSGVRLIEIPPVPDGYQFIACLTHDVDHPLLRQHKFDHTFFGFLYRATIGSLSNVFRGRASLRNLLTNWVAAFKLPFVHFGLAKDFWCNFDTYVSLEAGIPSTYFVIPFKGYAGRTQKGKAHRRRAAGYSASEIADHLRKLINSGCEVGLHGIDAWLDSSKGGEELEQIRQATGIPATGIRMHWLYFDELSPSMLERAGADYDSTIGYNETIGYRTGTTQAYKPLEANQLLELPLQIMDTALFFPCYLDLSPQEARTQVSNMINNAIQFGGSITINWHDRSIAPERLWGGFYTQLVDELKSKQCWFATAADTVSWFRKRREAVFEKVNGEVLVHSGAGVNKNLPGLKLRTYNAQRTPETVTPCRNHHRG